MRLRKKMKSAEVITIADNNLEKHQLFGEGNRFQILESGNDSIALYRMGWRS